MSRDGELQQDDGPARTGPTDPSKSPDAESQPSASGHAVRVDGGVLTHVEPEGGPHREATGASVAPDPGRAAMPFVASMPNDPAPPRPFPGHQSPPHGWQGGWGSPGGGPMTPYWRGERLVDPRVTDSDRILAVLMHLWWVGIVFTGFVPFLFLPVVIWAVRQSSSGFLDDHGREVLNMQLTTVLLAVSIVGLPFVPVLVIASLVNSIRAAIAASQREHFRYGMIFRPIG